MKKFAVSKAKAWAFKVVERRQVGKPICKTVATAQGLQPESVEVTKETPGISQSVIQETLLEVQVKGVTIRPLVQMLFQMEHAQPPMKLKGINIESGAGDGLLNAKLNLSGYLAKAEAAPGKEGSREKR